MSSQVDLTEFESGAQAEADTEVSNRADKSPAGGNRTPEADPHGNAGHDVARAVSTEADESRQCRGCGSHVSDAYSRTMGDNDNVVHSCPSCPDSTASDNVSGAPAGLDPTQHGGILR